jgi:hypothetical protein
MREVHLPRAIVYQAVLLGGDESSALQRIGKLRHTAPNLRVYDCDRQTVGDSLRDATADQVHRVGDTGFAGTAEDLRAQTRGPRALIMTVTHPVLVRVVRSD